MTKYRKKPVVIDAWLLTKDNWRELAKLCNAGVEIKVGVAAGKSEASPEVIGIGIPTLEGNMLASIGDYVIKGIKGEFYPCKPDIFLATYEPVVELPGDDLVPCPICNFTGVFNYSPLKNCACEGKAWVRKNEESKT